MADKKTTTRPETPDIDLERLFRELGGDGSVAVSRKEPDWARGHVRTVQTTANEPISMDWLTSKFGGSKLQVRVYGPDGRSLIGTRTVEVCAPPRDGFGIELVRGPEGNAVPVTRLEAEKRRYNDLHGITPPEPPAQLPEKPLPQQFDMTAMFTALITQQNQANSQLTQMLVNRIQHLEQMSIGQGVPSGPVQPADPPDPLGNLTNVVEVIGQLEAVKEKMGIADREPPSETAGMLDMVKAFMELHLEKQKAQVVQMQQGPPPAPPAHQLPQPPPNIPPQGPPQAEKTQDERDQELLMQLGDRLPAILEGLPHSQRKFYAEQVLGEPIDDVEDGEFDEYDEEKHPESTENAFEDGQGIENKLNSEQYDETGSEQDDPDPCTQPPPAQPQTPRQS